jgi:hypothetical protein
MRARRIVVAVTLLASIMMTASGATAAKGTAKGPNNGQAANRNTTQKFGPNVSLALFRAGQETGIVSAVSASGLTLSLPQALPLTVTVASTTTVTEGGAPVTAASIQQGYWIHVAGTFDRSTHAYAAKQIVILLPRVEGVVQTVSGAIVAVLSNRGDTVSVTTTSSTKWLRTQALRKRLRNMGSNDATSPITPTSSLSGTVTAAPAAGAAGAAVGDRVLVEGTPGADGVSITALRVLVGVPAGKVAAFSDDTPGTVQP